MRIAITGYNGFIATSIREKLKGESNTFLALNRTDSDDEWSRIIHSADVIINLAGAPVIQRWTKRNRSRIMESRVITTRRVVAILNQLDDEKQRVFISGSAIGIYPDDGEKVHDEKSSQRGTTFLTQVVEAWEQESLQLINKDVRLVIVRIGVVIGKEGGLIKKVLPVFKMGLGGRMGTGKQIMSFIHIDDLVHAFDVFIENKNAKGVFNLVSPCFTTNEAFTSALGNALKRKTWFTIPGFVLKLKFGKAANIMLKGERVYPKHLLDLGFEFVCGDIQKAIKTSTDFKK